jgi:hypothetical protein
VQWKTIRNDVLCLPNSPYEGEMELLRLLYLDNTTMMQLSRLVIKRCSGGKKHCPKGSRMMAMAGKDSDLLAVTSSNSPKRVNRRCARRFARYLPLYSTTPPCPQQHL